MEIGGLKEKVIAAHRAGLKTIIIPKENKKDLVELPKEVLKDLSFRPVSHMDEVIGIALTRSLRLGQIGSSQRQEHLQAILHA